MLQDDEQKVWLAELREFPDGPPETISLKSIILDITHRCNFNCPGCIEKFAMLSSKHSFLKLETIYNIIDKCCAMGVNDVSLYGGEPTMHPNFAKILKYMAKRIKKVRLITNGSQLKRPEVANAIIQAAKQTNLQIRVSLNSSSEETHNRLHGVKGYFKDIIRGLELITLKSKAQLCISFILCEENYNELVGAYTIAQNFNAAVFSIRAMTGQNGIQILPLSDKARSTTLVAIKYLQEKSKYPGNPKLDVCREYIHYLIEGCQPNTFKVYRDCYYCGSSRIVITPPDPGTAYSCPYWRGDLRFKIADLAEAPLGSQKFELRRQEAIKRITPCLDCADVICNRHEANLAIDRQRNAIYKNEGSMTVI